MSAELKAIQRAAAGRPDGEGIKSEDLAHPCLLVKFSCCVLRVGGADRLDLLHRMSTNALAGLKPGAVRSTVFVTEKGRIIDLVHVLVQEETLLLVTSAGMAGTVADWIAKFTIMEDVTVTDASGEFRLFLMSGPQAHRCLSRLGDPPRKDLWSGLFGEKAFVWTTAYEGVLAFLVDTRSGLPEKLAEAGARLLPAGALGAYRILHGIPGIGRELTAEYNPLEAGAQHAVSFTKGCYIGQEVIARLDTYNKVQRRPTGVIVDGFVPSAPAMLTLHLGGELVGHMTSSAAILEKTVGFAVIRRDVPDGASLSIGGEKSGLPPARITPFPIRLQAVVGSSLAGKER